MIDKKSGSTSDILHKLTLMSRFRSKVENLLFGALQTPTNFRHYLGCALTSSSFYIETRYFVQKRLLVLENFSFEGFKMAHSSFVDMTIQTNSLDPRKIS